MLKSSTELCGLDRTVRWVGLFQYFGVDDDDVFGQNGCAHFSPTIRLANPPYKLNLKLKNCGLKNPSASSGVDGRDQSLSYPCFKPNSSYHVSSDEQNVVRVVLSCVWLDTSINHCGLGEFDVPCFFAPAHKPMS